MKKPTYIKQLLIGILFLTCLNAISQTYQPWAVREHIEVKGSMLVVGNNILGRDNLTNNDNTIDNDMVNMQFIDIDSDPTTFNSSSANVVFQPHQDGTPTECYRVAYAALYWGAFLQDGERSNITSVKFKIPGSSDYMDVDGTLVYDAIVSPIVSEPGESGNTPYAAYANVTDMLSGLTDIEGTYTVANVDASEGFNESTGLSAGWTLFIIYEDPDLHTKSFTTFDGFSHIYDSHQIVVPVDGFMTPPDGHIDLQFAYATLDGDKTKRATKLEINGKEVTTPLRGPANRFFGAVIENYNGISHPRNPDGTNTLGYDTGMLEIFNSEPEYINNSATDATFALQVARGQADPIFPFMAAFAVDVISPEITLLKTVEDEFGNDINGDDVVLGQNLFYEISYQNTGNEDITNFTITDVLPDNIIFDPATDIDLTNSGDATLISYDPSTRTIIFSVPDESVEFGDPVFTIRLAVQVVPNCYDLSQACSNEVINQAFGTYTGVVSSITISDQASYVEFECNTTPQPTNFLVDISNCNFEREEVLCGSSAILTAANGYDSYSWSTSPSGIPVIGTDQTLTVTEVGTYYVTNTTSSTCISIEEVINVVLYGYTQSNPIIPYADEVSICPNDGKELPKLFLCGLNDTRELLTGISDATSIIWEVLNEGSCAPIGIDDCANESTDCTWNQVGTGSNFTVDAAGQFRLVINYPGGCYSIFYFNVYQNLLNPSAIAQDILCNTPGQITVNDVPNGYEYSIDGTNYQSSNVFIVTSPGYYTIYIRQVGVNTNPCIFQTPDVHVRERDFTVTTNVTQPECHGELGSIQIAVNDALPQYYYDIYEGGTLVDTYGPTTDSDYTFPSLNAGSYTVNVSTDDGCLYTEDIEIIEPPLLTATAALTQPLTCTDGEITVYPEGGTPPYIYYVNSTTDFQTSPIITVDSAGVYDITVMDINNCSAYAVVTVEAIPEPEFTVTQTDILCTGTSEGTISINVTNSQGYALQYSIDGGVTYFNSPVFTSLAQGSYDVVVQYTLGSAVCTTDSQTVTITAAPPLTGTAALDAPYTCTNDATITVSGVSGGTSPYTYSLDGINFQASNSFTGLTSGTYTITIQDTSGCTFIANSITIDSLDPPTGMTFSHTPLSCPSNTSAVTITGVTGGLGVLEYQIIAPTSAVTPYQSSNDFTGLTPGTYTFQVRDESGCTYYESYTIDPLTVSTVDVILTQALNCTVSSDAIITGTVTGTTPYTNAVSIDGSAYTSLGTTGSTFTYSTTTGGTYQFEITDGNGCTVESSIITVNPLFPPNISGVVQTQPILCSGDSNGAIDITIDTSVGTPPFTINVYNDTSATDYGNQTSGLPSGSYTITITDSNDCTATENIVLSDPAPLVLDYSTVDMVCFGGGISQGSITINSITGGTAPYTYYVNGSNGYSNSEVNATGSASTSFDSLDLGIYEINVIDSNGCSILEQDILIASTLTDLDINVSATVDCISGGQAIVSIGTSLVGTGPFFFTIYQGSTSVYPNPPGSWIPEDSFGSESATFNGLTPGVTYTFAVYDASTDCTYYEPSTAPIPTNSTLTATSLSTNNVSCTGSADGSVSFTINSIYGINVDVDYEIFDSLSLVSTGISGSGIVPAGGSLVITDLGLLPFGNYVVNIVETSGPNTGCGIVTAPFNIAESEILLNLTVSVDQNANCNVSSGVISTIGQDGTAPYVYQITTTPASPLITDPTWASTSTFNVNVGNYYVHVMDDYNCIVSSSIVVVPMDSSPVISASLNNQCDTIEGQFEIAVTLDINGIAPYSYSIDGGAFQSLTAPFTVSNLFSGIHTIEVQDINGCGNLVSVTILPPLEITPDITNLTTCNNDDGEITLTTSGGSGTYTYSISPNPASIIITGNIFSGVPSGIYTITVTDTVTTCTEEVTVSLSEATPPTFTTIPTAITCFGDNSGSFEINVADYSGPYTYELIDNLGVTVMGPISANTSTNPEVVNGMSAGSFTVVITETNTPFCSATNTVVITSPTEALILSASETSNVTCDNSQGTITATATGGWGDYEYELTGDAIVPFSSSGTFTNLSAGNYVVNVRDGSGCIDSVNVTLIEPTPISATATPNASSLACFGDKNASISIINVTGGVGSSYAYTLNTVLPTPSSSGPQTSNVFNNLGAGTYNVNISDGSGCLFTSVNIVITEPNDIDASLTTTSTQTCQTDATLTLSANGGTGTYEYSNDSTFTSILGSFTSSTTFTVSEGTHMFYVRDANGCISNASNEVTIETIPNLIIDLESENPTINCAGDNSGSIFATAQGGLGNYIYTLQDTSGNDITATQNSPGVFTELFSGTYVVLVESDDCNFTTAPITITEPSTILEVNHTVSDITCAGDNDGILTINVTGGTGVIKYAISPQMDQFFDTNVFEDLAPGDYQVIVQDELGCYVIFDFSIANAVPVLLNIVPGSIFEETCQGDNNGEFSIDISGGTLPYSVSLDNYDGPYTTGGATQTIFDFIELSGGDHMVYVRDAQGCESEWNITFPESVNIAPIAGVEYTCINNASSNTVTVTVDPSVDPVDLDYSLDGGSYQFGNKFTDVAPGNHTIDVRHTNGCIQTTEVFVIEDYQPLSLVLVEGNEAGEIFANAVGGTGIYEFIMNGENYGETNTFYATESGTYEVTVTDSAGCQAVAQIEIEILDPCIPNYFTPNNDGANDGWTISCSEKYPDLEFDIFDRYGRKVGTYSVGEYWDGRYNGRELPSGDYWYVVRPNSRALKKEYVGHFTLYR